MGTSTTLGDLQTLLGDRYDVVRELGRGGMATVYLATDRKLGREVAVKVLHPDLGVALGADRFRREIDVASRLSHPHILPIDDVGGTTGFGVRPLCVRHAHAAAFDRWQ